jgi:hypothetical protein
MLNGPVPAAAEGLPRFNRSEIMKAAWAHFRRAPAYVASNPFLAGTVVRFGDCLKEEWRRAKGAVAARAVEISAAVCEQVAALKREILNLDCKSFRYSIASEKLALNAKLSSLNMENA